MTYKTYTQQQLEALPLPTLKKIAAQIGTRPVVDARYKKTWILCILRKQSNLQQVVEIEEIEEIVIDEIEADAMTIDDSLVCGELGLEFCNPWASTTRKGHIEPSGSIVCEVSQDDRFIGCIRRHYNVAGLFYTTDRHPATHRTHYAAALSLLDAGEVEIARATVERNLDDQYISRFIAPAHIPTSRQFQVSDYCPKDQTDAQLLSQILQNGGRWFEVWSNGHDDYTSVIPGQYRLIGTIKVSPSGRCEYFLGRRGLNSGRNPIANSLEDAKEGIKQDFIAQQSPRAAKAWGEYLGTRSLAFA